MKRAITAAVGFTTVVAAMLLPFSAANAAINVRSTVYDATEAAQQLPSVGFEATGAAEFGDEVSLAGTARKKGVVSVQLSSWACQSGHWNTNDCFTNPSIKYAMPITLNVYEPSVPGPDGTQVPGQRLVHITKSFNLSYRPSANIQKCNGTKAGRWYSKADGKCYNGKAQTITFNLGSLRLPDTVVLSVEYNTSTAGYSPLGTGTECFSSSGGCFYDSLNVGLGTTGIHTGSKPAPATVFWNTSNASQYCDSTPKTGVFNQDSPTSACWHHSPDTDDPLDYDYDPAFKVTAVEPAPQT